MIEAILTLATGFSLLGLILFIVTEYNHIVNGLRTVGSTVLCSVKIWWFTKCYEHADEKVKVSLAQMTAAPAARKAIFKAEMSDWIRVRSHYYNKLCEVRDGH